MVVDEYGAPNPVKLKPCCPPGKVEALLSTAFGSTGGTSRPASVHDSWRCLFARTVDAAFFKVCIEKRFLLVPLYASDCPGRIVPGRFVLVVADDLSEARLSTAGDGGFFPVAPPKADWGGRFGRVEDDDEGSEWPWTAAAAINVGFKLRVSRSETEERGEYRSEVGMEQG